MFLVTNENMGLCLYIMISHLDMNVLDTMEQCVREEKLLSAL